MSEPAIPVVKKPDIKFGDTVECYEAPTRKKNAETKVGTVVFVGRKFVTVNVGNYTETYGFDQVAKVNSTETAV